MTRTCLQMVIFSMVLALGLMSAQAQDQYSLNKDQWVQKQTYTPGSPEAQLQAIRKMVAQGQGKQAIKAVKKFMPTH